MEDPNIPTAPSPLKEVLIAWTGGSKPAPFDQIGLLEKSLVHAIMDAQCATYEAFWGKETPPTARLQYWTRARYDAHATVRSGCLVKIPDTNGVREVQG